MAKIETVIGMVTNSTDKALQIVINDKKEWYPRSTVELVKGNISIGEICIFDIETWVLEQKGVI